MKNLVPKFILQKVKDRKSQGEFTATAMFIDIKGFTPIYKASLMENSSLKITFDKNTCKGAGFCEQVCPQNCFEVNEQQHTATMPGVQRCIRCGACIVQCPFDALWFETSDGNALLPDTVRKFKLNLMGKRQARLQ